MWLVAAARPDAAASASAEFMVKGPGVCIPSAPPPCMHQQHGCMGATASNQEQRAEHEESRTRSTTAVLGGWDYLLLLRACARIHPAAGLKTSSSLSPGALAPAPYAPAPAGRAALARPLQPLDGLLHPPGRGGHHLQSCRRSLPPSPRPVSETADCNGDGTCETTVNTVEHCAHTPALLARAALRTHRYHPRSDPV